MLFVNNIGLRRGPQDVRRDIQVPLAPIRSKADWAKFWKKIAIRFRLLLRRVLPKDDFGPEELSEWLESLSNSRCFTLVQQGIVGRNDFGSTHIDALRKVTAAGYQDGRDLDFYAPPLLVKLDVIDARDHEVIAERAMEQVATQGNWKAKKLWFDLGILALDELWRFESERLRIFPGQLRCLSFVVAETLSDSLLCVYHPSLGFPFLDLQKVQHLRPEIKAGSVIMAPIFSTNSAEGTTLLPSDYNLGFCNRTTDLSKLVFPEPKEYETNEALPRLRALIRGEMSAEEVQAAESADLESEGVSFRIPFGGRLEERVLQSVQEQLVGKWFTLRVEYLTKEFGDVFHPLFVNNPRCVPSGLLGTLLYRNPGYLLR